MLTVKCPHCSTALKLKQAPASGKVKCPKCNGIVPARAAKPAAARPVAAGASPQSLDPDDEGFDFARINYPSASPVTAVSQFPVAAENMEVYQGPIPGDPLEALAAENGEAQEQAQVQQAPPPKKLSPAAVVGALAGVGVLVIGMVVAGVMLTGSGGGSGDQEDPLVKLQASAPTGYQAVGHRGCVTLVPKGQKINTKLRTVIADDLTVVESSATGSYFFFGAMDGGTREIDNEQMRKKASRQLGGDFLGGTPSKRNGYEGIKGKLDGSLFVPNMMVEAYHIDGRFIIIGCAPASFESDPTVQFAVNRQLEAEEQKVFYDSFKVGPKPSGWLF